ncbi:Malate/lactate/ureidoglycolate dehydrogenase, LDH2 family [Caballeronia arationis]|uniref:Malate/lactate/ureidoglycolate dehydrogenase, LDH2 family n=1 Tax=Caballeronia arationis TaxID=1777142 RepID=A0A7Z7IEQ7_9BURK|nr:Ldh family oxidoreductase [Caballeronia arationis]SOE91224.1 Malate/lactate/ureidoglycolate dehydrogenase, LDH2 family [Caballeronia arationis]
MNTRWLPEIIEGWTAKILEGCDVPPEQATEAASMLVRSELRGYKTHGMTRLASYAARLQANEFNPRPQMTHRVLSGGIVLNADGAMGQIAGPHAVRLGLEALRTTASVLIVMQSCGHLGALGIHTLLAAEGGAFSMMGQHTPPALAMEGFRGPAIGHNPIAFGCPLPGQAPIVFDVACSVAARGHVLLAAREGKPIPEGWALDAQGRPTTDAQLALEGSLMPMSGHKGMGIAMMVECLAGALAASAASLGAPRGDAMQDAFLWLVRPEAYAGREAFDEYMRQWTQTYVSASADARLPGMRGDAIEREARMHGMTLPTAIAHELAALGERLGVPLPT